MSQGRPLPAVELARFAGLFEAEELPAPAAPTRRTSPPAPTPPPRPTLTAGNVVLDGATIARQVREVNARDDLRDMLRAAFGRALVGVRMQSGSLGTVILAVLRRHAQVPRPRSSRWETGESIIRNSLDVDHADVEVQVDVTEAVLASDYEALRRLASEHVR